MSKATSYPERPCLHHLFEAQADLTPDRAAVIFEDDSLTYRELNARANQLARYLQKLGLFASRQERRLRLLEDINKKAFNKYFAPIYPGRIVLIRSTEFSSLDRKNFHLRWADFAAGGLDCATVPGTHTSILLEPDIEKLAGVLKGYLGRAHAREMGKGIYEQVEAT